MGMQKPQKFISHIAQRRRDLNLTQRDLANMIGVTETTIRNWEKGNLDWLNKVALLCEILDCSPEALTQNFQQLRDDLKLTQLEVAQELRVVENTFAKWEKGNFDWANKAVKLYQALKCQLKDLYSMNPEVIPTRKKELAPSGQELLDSLNPNGKNPTPPNYPILFPPPKPIPQLPSIFFPKIRENLP